MVFKPDYHYFLPFHHNLLRVNNGLSSRRPDPEFRRLKHNVFKSINWGFSTNSNHQKVKKNPLETPGEWKIPSNGLSGRHCKADNTGSAVHKCNRTPPNPSGAGTAKMFGMLWYCREASELSSGGPKLVWGLLPVSCPGVPNKRKRDCREEEQENKARGAQENQDRD